MVGLKKGCNFQLIKDCHWVFFKEDEIFYRITLMQNFSLDLSPTLVAEITQKGDILGETEDEIKHSVINHLIKLGIVGSIDHIAEVDIKLVNYTYPIPTIGLETAKATIRSILEKYNILLLGRNGNWDYINMDGVILKVKEFLEKMDLNTAGIPA